MDSDSIRRGFDSLSSSSPKRTKQNSESDREDAAPAHQTAQSVDQVVQPILNTSFTDLNALSSFLHQRVVMIVHGEESGAQIDQVIQVLRQNEVLLNDGINHPKALIHFSMTASFLKMLSPSESGYIDQVLQVAPSWVTLLEKISLQEIFDVYKSLKEVDNDYYLRCMARTIAQHKITTGLLTLTKVEWLELAPHLTFFGYVGDGNGDQDEFLGEFLERSLQLTELRIANSQMRGTAFDRFKNFDQLKNLKIENCPNFNHPLPAGMLRLVELQIENCGSFCQLLPEGMISLRELKLPPELPITFNNALRVLLPIFRVDIQRALGLENILKLGVSEEILHVYYLFVSHHPDKLDDIVFWLQRTTNITSVVRGVERGGLSLIKADLLKDDPQQCIYLLALVGTWGPELLELIEPLIQTPMDLVFLMFYDQMRQKRLKGTLQGLTTTPLLHNLSRERQLRCIPYMFENVTKLEIVFHNIQKLENTELFDHFILMFTDVRIDNAISERIFPQNDSVRFALETENFFTENCDDNLRIIIQLYEYLFVFFQRLDANDLGSGFPAFLKDANAFFQTTVGLIFLKVYLSDIVQIPELQGAALRALPPVNDEAIALYPKEINFDDDKMYVKVVPTLTVLVAKHFLINMAKGFALLNLNKIEVHYYGTPAMDASGVGRHFFAEVVQGALVNEKAFFIQTADGGMAPFDPTHSLNRNEIMEVYRDYGMFFSFALHCQYPIGKVLSEKVLSAICSFPRRALKSKDFDAAEFISEMNAVELVQYMKKSTTDDAASVQLYETIMLGTDEAAILQAARVLNAVMEDEKIAELIHGGAQNLPQIQAAFRNLWIEGASFYLYAVNAIAQGMNWRLPKKIGEYKIYKWEHVRVFGPEELSRHLQGELTAQHVKDNIKIRIIGQETPEKNLIGYNVKRWTENWIDEHAENPEALANFVQGFTGGRALAREIRFMIDPKVNQIRTHTCFNSADIPLSITEAWLRAMFDEYAAGYFDFNIE